MSALLKKRVQILEDTLNFITNLRLELQYRADNLNKLIIYLNDLSGCRNLDFLKVCSVKMSMGKDFPDAWKGAIFQSELPLKSEEKTKLSSMADFLGTTDKESQSELLILYEEYFSTFLRKAVEENERYSKICIMLGIVSGFSVFIMVV